MNNKQLTKRVPRKATPNSVVAKRKRQATRPLISKVAPAYLRAIADPCNIRNVRIPDGNMAPTVLTSLRQVFTVTRLAGSVGEGVLPIATYIYFQPHYIGDGMYSSNQNGGFQIVDQYPATEGVTLRLRSGDLAPSATPYSQMLTNYRSWRPVSACIQSHWVGSTFHNGGVIWGAVLPSGQLPYGNADVPYLESFPDGTTQPVPSAQSNRYDNYSNFKFGSSAPLKMGMECLYFPTGREDFHFQEKVEMRSSPEVRSLTFLSGCTVLTQKIDWGHEEQAVQVIALANYECYPRYGYSSPDGAVTRARPDALSAVGSWASHLRNVIHTVTPLVTSAVQGYRVLRSLTAQRDGPLIEDVS